MLIPYGLDRLPRDPRRRCVEVGDQPLRLNSEPVPADAMPLVTGDHGALVAAAREWLESQCGDYAPLRRQFIAAYFRWIAAEIDTHRAELLERLKPYDGLYTPEDFFWSALRPLPRGWVPVDDRYLPTDIAFWDGSRVIAIELGARATEREAALLATGCAACRIEPDAFGRLNEKLPALYRRVLDDILLPSSPFRRVIPTGVLSLECA